MARPACAKEEGERVQRCERGIVLETRLAPSLLGYQERGVSSALVAGLTAMTHRRLLLLPADRAILPRDGLTIAWTVWFVKHPNHTRFAPIEQLCYNHPL